MLSVVLEPAKATSSSQASASVHSSHRSPLGGGDALACPPSYTAASLSGRDAVLALLVGPDAEKNAELLDFAWHILFGQPAVTHAPYMHTH